MDKAEIWYVHRGAPNNTKIISGNEILSIDRSFIETTTAMIPYHRIFKIVYKGEIIFKRWLINKQALLSILNKGYLINLNLKINEHGLFEIITNLILSL